MNITEEISKKINNREKVLLMFDYDGTLTPIVEKPELAILDNKTKKALEAIAENDLIKIAIISGRDIETLKQLSGITSMHIILFGLHGGQTQVEGEIHDYSSETQKNKICEISKTLEKELTVYKGIILENKGLSVAVHYRLAENNAVEDILRIVKDIFNFYNSHNEFILQPGKKVLEILPAGFSKDKAVNHLISFFPDCFPVYFGDDITDISAIKETINHNGSGILVGDNNSLPANTVGQVIDFEMLNEFIVKTAKNKIQSKLEVI